jgi:hypothetical protein
MLLPSPRSSVRPSSEVVYVYQCRSCGRLERSSGWLRDPSPICRSCSDPRWHEGLLLSVFLGLVLFTILRWF